MSIRSSLLLHLYIYAYVHIKLNVTLPVFSAIIAIRADFLGTEKNKAVLETDCSFPRIYLAFTYFSSFRIPI